MLTSLHRRLSELDVRRPAQAGVQMRDTRQLDPAALAMWRSVGIDPITHIKRGTIALELDELVPPIPLKESVVQGPTLNFPELPPHLPPHLGPRLCLKALLFCEPSVRGLGRDNAGNALLGPWSGALAPMIGAAPCTRHCRALAWVSALVPRSTAFARPLRTEPRR